MADVALQSVPRNSQRKSFAVIALSLICYFATALAYYGKPITVRDELSYVRQAKAFAVGQTTITITDPSTGEKREAKPGRYAPGTSALMAPFVYVFGWQGAYLVPMLMLAVAVVAMAVWLAEEGRSPLWALFMMAHPAVLVLGFHAMSDVPSMAMVTVTLFLFWRGAGRHWSYWLAAGFLASASCLVRETNAIVYIPFFCGALIRRERGVGALILGGLLGMGFAAMGEYLAYGQLLRRSGELDAFSLWNIYGNIPLYLVATMVNVPAGLVVAFCYRGPRAPELRLTIVVFVGFMLTWTSAVEGGLVNQLILHAPRFTMSLLPVFVWAWAEVGPRWWEALVMQRVSAAVRGYWTRGAVACAVVSVILGSVIVHPIFSHWRQIREHIIQEIYANTPEDSLVVTNYNETRKVINELYGPRVVVDLEAIKPAVLQRLLATRPSTNIVLLFRADGAYWRQRSSRLRDRLNRLRSMYDLSLILDQRITATDQLQIWRVERSRNV